MTSELPAEASIVRSEASPLRVLLVEDDEVDRIAIRRTFRRHSEAVRLEEVGGAVEMRAALASNQFDCALLDQGLPDGEGLDLIREIAKVTNQKTAVVVLTGVDDEARALRALSEGADDYLIKSRIDDYTLLRSVRYATERKRSEALRAQVVHMDRLVAVGRLAAGVAHEIATPLNCIIGNLSSLPSELDQLSRFLGLGSSSQHHAAELFEAIRDSLTAAEQVAGIVKDLRMLAHADDRPVSQLCIEKTLDRAISIASVQIRARATLRKEYGGAPTVRANAQRLIQIFINLLVNAAQAIPEGDPNANEVRISTGQDDVGWAVVEISDSGVGISSADGPRMFEPFFTTKSTSEGTGLGLSICWSIIASLGGDITYRPRPEGGTIFRIALPPAPGDGDASDELTPGPILLGSTSRSRVLVIDDDPMILRMWSAVLSKDFEITTSSNARAVLKQIEGGERYDVIVSDLMMPIMDGSEFCKALRSLAPDQEARTVILTGGAASPDVERFLEGRSGRYLKKPITGAVLRDHINRIVRARQAT